MSAIPSELETELLEHAGMGVDAATRILSAVRRGSWEDAAKFAEALKSLTERIQHDAEAMRDQLKQDSEL